MKLLLELDEKNYHQNNVVFFREAVRAIIIIEGKLLLIRSKKYHEMKFIGGGVEKGEDYVEALKREALEEGGVVLKDNIIEFGYVIEKRQSLFNENETFLMHSYYYLCEVESYLKQNLQDYEIDYGYELVLVDVDEAIKNNYQVGFTNKDIPWTSRDTKMFEIVKEQILSKKKCR
jgi:8-oxo-dGTP pyrophosphatase MutT (NUDIX family)